MKIGTEAFESIVRKIVREAKYIIGECEQIRELVCGRQE